MHKQKTTKNLFESWGKSKREFPQNSDVLKREILAKVPINYREEVSFKRSPFVWVPFAFSALAVLVLLVNVTGLSKSTSRQNDVQTGLMPQTETSQSSDYSKSIAPIMMPYYTGGELPITDQREFLKVGYNATLRTRKITELKNQIEMIIRGSDGRVDASNAGEKSGYISFAIPKSDLESFKFGIKDLVGAKFYSENTSAQNFLPQKQMIEENQRQTEKNLNDLQTERGQIVKTHNQKISSYQTSISSKNTEINNLNIEYQYANTTRKAEIINRINQLQAEINGIQTDMQSENRVFQAKISNIDEQIKNTQENLKAIQKEDSNLLDNVATVNGTIYLNWISFWEIADLYLPGPLLAWIFFLAAVLSFIWYRYISRRSYLDFY